MKTETVRYEVHGLEDESGIKWETEDLDSAIEWAKAHGKPVNIMIVIRSVVWWQGENRKLNNGH